MQKIKQFLGSETGKDVLVILIVILVGLGSFELGRLSKGADSGGLKVEYPGGQDNIRQAQKEAPGTVLGLETSKATTSPNSSGKAFFASSRGSKYYPLGCAGGKSIKQENRVYFASAEAAQTAGYQLSSTCK
ncbi:MAG: hypothetical protein V4486_01375 [Patescibacteria group bacterium]